MLAHRINVLTHDLSHQCRIADVSRCNVAVDKKRGDMASNTPAAAPYVQGKRFNNNACCIVLIGVAF